MFPICGALKEDKYTYKGKEYHLPRHGFARTGSFAVESREGERVVFLLCSDEESKKIYPFDFELRVIYRLEGKSLHIDYSVKNLGGETMYFSLGSHEGYSTPGGIENYEVIFSQEETADSWLLSGTLLSGERMPLLKNQRVLPLSYSLCDQDSLIFKDLRSRTVTLRNRSSGRSLRVDFPDDNYFLIWTKPGAPYVCLEPWSGMCDTVGTSYDIEKKEGIIALPAQQEYLHTHSITLE